MLRLTTGSAVHDIAPGVPFRVGRDPYASVVIDHELVSRDHLVVEYTDGWLVRDAGSRNGTWADGRPLGALRPVPGVIHSIRLGDPNGPEIRIELQGLPGMATPVAAPAYPPMPGTSRPLTIGRESICDVVLDDPLVSRQHCRIVPGPVPTITDLASFNGTYVNGARIEGTVQLPPGAWVEIGQRTYEFDGTALREATPTAAALDVRNVVVRIGPKTLLDDISLTLPVGSLTAVIGPSGAGKSTLLATLTGSRTPTTGQVLWQGNDLHRNYDAIRSHIGLVPQQDIQHNQLTVRRALRYAAELRLPPDTGSAERVNRVDAVIRQLQLEKQADQNIGRTLSGGQRKRVSIATELLTAPPLLFLDEPTSGLDPALDRDVMNQLRTLADEGRVVVTVTHNTAALELCDYVLVLATGGAVAYFGKPDELFAYFGVSDHVGVFQRLAAERIRQTAGPQAPPRAVGPPPTARPSQPILGQLSTVARRTTAVAASDRMLLGLLVLMPIVLGAMAHVVPGDHGLRIHGVSATSGEPGQRLTILVVGSCLMGIALTIRELVRERPILEREHAVGLSLSAYWTAKMMVFGVLGAAQGLLFATLALAGVPGPDGGGVIGWGKAELILPIALCTSVMAVLGLAMSALVRSSEQAMPALVGMVMLQLVLSGALVPIAGRAVLEQAAWFSPARWAHAAAAASIGMNALKRQAGQATDVAFAHEAHRWWTDLGMVGGLGLALALVGYAIFQSVTSRRG